ncbi:MULTISPECIES: MarR family transcriptional regulator [unclassified Streptomyces]|uniref:MarR family winged helix-turn-helix transcriptional regulator n=1 Tax=unclassified Streptomyces TaxID=2593676 RepID=UPI002E772F87|nr:MarR family transcriptional regulator [Streptomyces sp. JV176]MEE1799098.1 MarR family transcriptional regulator [Streptomyces sp. JV176]
MSTPPPDDRDDRSTPGDGDDILAVMPRIAQLSNAITRGRLIEHVIETAGITLDRPALSTLIALHLADKPLRISQIAEKMQVVQPHVTRQVQQLERRGLVHRIGDPNDRRVSLIEPTAKGATAADRYTRTLVGWFTGAVAHWPEQDRQDLGRLLSRLADDVTAHLSTLDDAPPSD